MAADVKAFIERWSKASASERTNSQLFLSELCDVLEVLRPDPTFEHGYAFEFPVRQQQRDGSESIGRIDLYKRGCFVLESKQFHAQQAEPTELQLAVEQARGSQRGRRPSGPVRGSDKWDDAMFKARGQAERYIRSLPAEELNPPFLIVIDVGDTFEVFADFTQAGKAYVAFPDPRSFRIRLRDLEREEIRERLRLIWSDPLGLDPSRVSAAVTREIAQHLAALAKSLEEQGHKPHVVAGFLSRCLFCMFAEDVGLLPKDSFGDLLKSLPQDGEGFVPLLTQLFREMNTGTGRDISVVLRKKLLRFNGGLFADETVLPLNKDQLFLLRLAACKQWRNVEPAIFGTLLERALDPHERHKLGAHYTPRGYVERLVLATIIEPIRGEWEAVRAAALTHARADKIKQARGEILSFHRKLCEVRVLDPACGSGNFLYVALEHLKRLEGEVLDLAATFGENLLLEITTHTVDPHQFLGLEVNPRAASITELVLWIGYLQWHFRTRGQTMPAEPVLKNFENIECRDAVMTCDGEPEPVRDGEGNIKTVWDRRSFKKDLVTARDVPDETKRVALLTYRNPRPAEWPKTDYIVGNPPFLGKSMLRTALGDGYIEKLREAYPDVPDSVDFVMYWWHKAAQLARSRAVKRFGLITTNAIGHAFNRRVVSSHVTGEPPLFLAFAVPDHPWVDTAEGSAVRITMTVGTGESVVGELANVVSETGGVDGAMNVTLSSQHGMIQPDITIGPNVSAAIPLKANSGLTSNGVMLGGRGFLVLPDEAMAGPRTILRPILNGNDVLQHSRSARVIDFCGLSIEQARAQAPEAYQQVMSKVKPERDANRRASRREKWWLFSEVMPQLRRITSSLRRYIGTPETSKHRIFVFLDAGVIPEHPLIAIGSDDAFVLGVLSSRVHLVYCITAGGTLEDRPRYNKSVCFDPFPFPDCETAQKEHIGRIAEELDAHRNRVQAQHPGITLTGMYNVLEKLRANEPLTAKEKQIHDTGLVSVLRQLHDDLDAVVFEAYAWPKTLPDSEILERVVALNIDRAREEASGRIRWLRPGYQNPEGATSVQLLKLDTSGPRGQKLLKVKKLKIAWPKTLPERVKAVSDLMRSSSEPMTIMQISKAFARAKAEDVGAILETLCVMGQARRGTEKGTYTM